jgi:hypothetical protein
VVDVVAVVDVVEPPLPVMSPPAPVEPEVVTGPVVVVSPVVVLVAPDTVVPAEVVPPTVVGAPAAPDEPGETASVGVSELPQSTRHTEAASNEPTPKKRIFFMTSLRWVGPRKRINVGEARIGRRRRIH